MEETSSHYFLVFFLYSLEPQALFGLFEHYIPNLSNFTKQMKLEIMLRGVHIENDEFLSTNTSIKIQFYFTY